MRPEDLSYGIAFLVGLGCFFSPCILPLIPAYLSFLSGISTAQVKEGGMSSKKRWVTFSHGVMFVLGFSVVFVVLLGGAGQALKGVLLEHKVLAARIGGGIVALFGIYLTGLFKLGFLEREWRFHLTNKPMGYLGSALVGVVFAFGWTPCLGPGLGAILTFSASSPHGSAMAMMGFFALGLAVPFLLAAIAGETFFRYFGALKRHTRTISIVAGLILVAVGISMMAGWFNRLSFLLGG